MTTKTQHTPLETKIYSVNGHPTIGLMIEGSWVELNELNKERLEPIVTACNNHYELLEACKEMLQCVCDYNEGKDAEVNDWIKSWSEIVAKAEGR